MHVRNPLEANDWDFASFFVLIASLQALVWVLLGLDAIGLRVPILRELLVLIYLLFVPGILLLRILKVHELDSIEGLLYAVGLSVATVMLTGLFMNAAYLRFIPRPISLLPFIATMTALVAVLLLLCYRRDRAFSRPTVIDVQLRSSPVPVALCLLPFMSIFGAYWFNLDGTSVGVIITLLSVAALILVCGFTSWVPRRYYGLAILVAAVALLLHNALISNFLWGNDIQGEYAVAQFVVSNGFWGAPPAMTHAEPQLHVERDDACPPAFRRDWHERHVGLQAYRSPPVRFGAARPLSAVPEANEPPNRPFWRLLFHGDLLLLYRDACHGAAGNRGAIRCHVAAADRGQTDESRAAIRTLRAFWLLADRVTLRFNLHLSLLLRSRIARRLVCQPL